MKLAIYAVLVSSMSLKAGMIPILSVDFENQAIGDYDKTDLQSDWPAAQVFKGVNEGADDGRVSIVADPTGATNQVLEVRYPAAGVSTGGSGASWVYEFSQPQTAVVAQYDIFIPTGTEFGKGGKLPGLAGGLRDENPGFTNRMMWRSENADGETSGGATAPRGSANIVYYTHHLDLDREIQQDFKWIDPASTSSDQWLEPTLGTWHTIKQHVVLDSMGNDDGVIRGYWDGVLMSEVTGLNLTDDTYQIDQFYFSTFYGGNDSSWAPGMAGEQKIYFDNFQISAVPEPSGALLAALFLTVGLSRRRRTRRPGN